MNSTKTSATRLILSILGALIVGALGSGLWDVVLRDMLFKLGNLVLSLLVMVWSGYVEVLHQGIGKLRGDLLVIPVYAIVCATMVVGPFFLIYYLHRHLARIEARAFPPAERKSISEPELKKDLNVTRKLINWGLVPVSVVFVFLSVIQLWQIEYTRNAATWAEQSIEILAPQIGLEEVARLRAELRSVQRAKQFYLLEKKLRESAIRHDVNLPSFSSIGEADGG